MKVIKGQVKSRIFNDFRKSLILLSVIIGVFAPFIVFATPWYLKPFYAVVKASFSLIIAIEAWILKFVGFLFNIFVNPENQADLVNSSIVNTGWTITRDVFNMFFIIILLIIAFATILRIESYSYKVLLPKLVFGIILVNFSRTICRIVIEFFHLLMNAFGFQNMSGGKISEQFGLYLGIKNLASLSDVYKSIKLEGGLDVDIQVMVGWVLLIILLFLLAFALFAIAILLMIRAVALMFLTILSPAAFVLNIIPATKEYFQKWWTNFFKYLIYGPAALFGVYLTMKAAEVALNDPNQSGGSLVKEETWKNVPQGDLSIIKGTDAPFLFNWAVVFVLLVATVYLARTLGIYGAGIATGLLKMGLGAIKAGGGWGQRRLIDLKEGRLPLVSGALRRAEGLTKSVFTKMGGAKGGQFADRMVEKLKKAGSGILGTITALPELGAAWKERRKTLEAEYKQPTVAAAADALDYVLGFGEKRHRREQVERANVEKALKEQDAKSSAEYQRMFLEGYTEGNLYKMEGAMRAAARTNNLNDMFSNKQIWDIFKDRLLKDGLISEEEYKFAEDKGEGIFDDRSVKAVIGYIFGTEADGRGARTAADIGEIAFAAGNKGLIGMTKIDEKGRLVFTTDEEQDMIILDKSAKEDPQMIMRTTHSNTSAAESAGEFIGAQRGGLVEALNWTKAHLEQIKRMRPDRIKAFNNEVKVNKTFKIKFEGEDLTVQQEAGKKITDVYRDLAEKLRDKGFDEKAKIVEKIIDRIEEMYQGEKPEAKEKPLIAPYEGEAAFKKDLRAAKERGESFE